MMGIPETLEEPGISRTDNFTAGQSGQIAGLAAPIQDFGGQVRRKISPAKMRKFQYIGYNYRKYFPLAAVLLFAALVAGAGAVRADGSEQRRNNGASVARGFRLWINGPLWRKAKARGVSRALFQRAFRGVRLNWKLPDLLPPGAPRQKPRPVRQSEFRSPGVYFRPKHINYMIQAGRRELKKWRKSLDAIERRYGVPRGVIIAIWGKETAFGRARLPHNAIRILATQAYMGRRKKMFEAELLAALDILQQGHIGVDAMKSAWAGALGHPQFMPTAFLKYAVDFDGDGRKNIWTSVPDALASIANYLSLHGWNRRRGWGYEVTLPQNVSCALEGPDQGASIAKWRRAGVRRVKGRAFPASELRRQGFLLLPAGRYGPAFIVTENFYVLKSYNESDVYALFVSHLADRFRRNAAFVGKWRRLSSFSRRDVRHMQNRLIRQGHDVGGADGLIGFKTRTAIGKWQTGRRLPPTCYPSPAILQALR